MKRILLAALGVLLWTGMATAQDYCAPAKVTDLATTTYYGAIALAWTATGDDGSTGTPYEYEIRWSTTSFNEDNWQCNSTQLIRTGSAGNGQPDGYCKDIIPCSTGTRYFAIFIFDEAGNRSRMSDVVTGSARCTPPYETCF